MAITYGFFNSINGDRTYDADDMSNYFKGLISNGVFEDVGGALQVLDAENNDMTVNVATGRGVINCKWINNDAVLTLPVTAAHVTLNRWTAVIMKLDIVNRLMDITTKDGTPASTPVKPTMTNDGTAVELCLAYIYVAAGATTISQADIEDTRASSACGWITGLINQVDTSTLFIQWQTAYSNYYTQMTLAFDAWFSSLTEELNVDTFVQHFTKRAVIGTGGATHVVSLDMLGYTYNSSDIICVYINGLRAISGVHYALDTTGATPTVTTEATANGTEIFVEVFKSKIGFETLVDNNNNNLVDDNNNDFVV